MGTFAQLNETMSRFTDGKKERKSEISVRIA